VNLGPEKPVPPAANLPGELTSANPVPDAYSQPIAFRDDKNSPSDPYQKWLSYNVIMAPSGKVSAYAHIRLGDITSEQFAELADIQRELQAEVRTTIRQNLVFKNLTVEQLPTLFKRLDAIKMSTPCAWLARDVVSCPGADSCNLAVTQSRGLATDISRALEEAGLAEIGEVRINISGCSDSCGQHHTADIGFMGAERRAHGQSAPGYQMFLGGYVDENGATFGAKALRLPAKNASEAAVRVIARFADERNLGESFHEWLQRQGGAKAVAANLADLDNFPTPEENPGF
jgi:sulfite reductase beta subunit-like hemoprotein